MLRGQKLADAYARAYAKELQQDTSPRHMPNVWATYLGGGWIELRGECLPANRALKHLYPCGWSLLDRKRSSYVRTYLDNQ